MRKFNMTGPVFEKSKVKSWDEKIYSRDETFDGKTIRVIWTLEGIAP